MNCGAEGCTGYHGRDKPYREQCPRTRGAHTSPESASKYDRSDKGLLRKRRYNGSAKGALVTIRRNIRQKEAQLYGETD